MKAMLFIFLIFSPHALGQSLEIGSGYSNSSGNGNASDNASGNAVELRFNHTCLSCPPKAAVKAEPSYKWHPPLVEPKSRPTK